MSLPPIPTENDESDVIPKSLNFDDAVSFCVLSVVFDTLPSVRYPAFASCVTASDCVPLTLLLDAEIFAIDVS